MSYGENMGKMNYNRPQYKKKEIDYHEIRLGEKLRHDKIKQRAPMPVKSVQEQKGNKVIEIVKNSTQIIRIEESEYQGHDLIDCRVYYDDNGEWRPTKQGISLSKNTAQKVVEGISQIMEESNWNEFETN
jgi:ribosomal 30S subunit maturation factor RimM|tara:strand:+ start:611 stop:1000 length:390 start_codon:yes stop_codon:yes gene_type:complete